MMMCAFSIIILISYRFLSAWLTNSSKQCFVFLIILRYFVLTTKLRYAYNGSNLHNSKTQRNFEQTIILSKLFNWEAGQILIYFIKSTNFV